MLAARKNDPKDLVRLIEANLEIPTIPVVASRALKEMSDPEVSAGKLARIIAEDQGLTARILKVANSALYALKREVKNLQQAATILGFEALKGIVVSVSCRMIYKRFGQVERTLWEHSVGAAVAAHLLARAQSLRSRDEAFVAGLMHDVGKVVMNNGDRVRFTEAVRLSTEGGLESQEAEREVFGFSHLDVGALLVKRWGLPANLEQAVLLHHEPELAEILAPECEDLVYVVSLADRLCHSLGLGVLSAAPIFDPTADPAALHLGFAPDQLESLAVEIRATYDAEHQALA